MYGKVTLNLNLHDGDMSKEFLNVLPSLSGVTLAKVQEWLKKLPTSGTATVDCGGQSLDDPQIAAVEKAVLDMKV